MFYCSDCLLVLFGACWTYGVWQIFKFCGAKDPKESGDQSSEQPMQRSDLSDETDSQKPYQLSQSPQSPLNKPLFSEKQELIKPSQNPLNPSPPNNTTQPVSLRTPDHEKDFTPRGNIPVPQTLNQGIETKFSNKSSHFEKEKPVKTFPDPPKTFHGHTPLSEPANVHETNKNNVPGYDFSNKLNTNEQLQLDQSPQIPYVDDKQRYNRLNEVYDSKKSKPVAQAQFSPNHLPASSPLNTSLPYPANIHQPNMPYFPMTDHSKKHTFPKPDQLSPSSLRPLNKLDNVENKKPITATNRQSPDLAYSNSPIPVNANQRDHNIYHTHNQDTQTVQHNEKSNQTEQKNHPLHSIFNQYSHPGLKESDNFPKQGFVAKNFSDKTFQHPYSEQQQTRRRDPDAPHLTNFHSGPDNLERAKPAGLEAFDKFPKKDFLATNSPEKTFQNPSPEQHQTRRRDPDTPHLANFRSGPDNLKRAKPAGLEASDKFPKEDFSAANSPEKTVQNPSPEQHQTRRRDPNTPHLANFRSVPDNLERAKPTGLEASDKFPKKDFSAKISQEKTFQHPSPEQHQTRRRDPDTPHLPHFRFGPDNLERPRPAGLKASDNFPKQDFPETNSPKKTFQNPPHEQRQTKLRDPDTPHLANFRSRPDNLERAKPVEPREEPRSPALNLTSQHNPLTLANKNVQPRASMEPDHKT